MKRLFLLSDSFFSNVKSDGLRSALLKTRAYLVRLFVGDGVKSPPPDWQNPLEKCFAYLDNSAPARQQSFRVFIAVARRGNFFMAEIAQLLADALAEAGHDTILVDEFSEEKTAPEDKIVIVAPHEFFFIETERPWYQAIDPAAEITMFNTEQIQTQWFSEALKHIKGAHKVWDINYQSAAILRANGMNAYFLPLLYSERYYAAYPSEKPVRRTLATESLDKSTLEGCPETFADRPIDILFVGTVSERRAEFFSRNAAFFSKYRCFLYLPQGNAPFLTGADATVSFDQMIALTSRAKVMLNIHRDADRYFEWQRIANIGIAAGAVVVSETCDSNPTLAPGRDYFEAPLPDLLNWCAFVLENPRFSSDFAENARRRFREAPRLAAHASRLLEIEVE